MAADSDPKRRHWWRDVALVGLLVTLVFNTVGVWLQQEQARQTKDATQLGLLTTLNVTAKQAEADINATEAPDLRCEPNQVSQLKDKEEAALTEALEFYDYLAWLFARKHVSLKDADRYLAPRMIDAYALGETFLPPRRLASDFHYLKEFRDAAPEEWHPPRPCR